MKNANALAYHLVELTPGRRVWLNALDIPGPTHWMYGLLEVDVTLANRLIDSHKKRTGEVLSFTGFLVHCLARAVEENKEVQSYLKGRKQVMVFEDVNVGLLVEHTAGEKKALMGHVIQAANRKTYRQVHDEIRAVQSSPAPANRGMPGWFRTAMLLPWPFSGLVKSFMGISSRWDPRLRAVESGTVFISSVGMFGKGHSGWGISASPHSLSLVVGSMAWKAWVVDGQVEPRQVLNLTVIFDHDVVDGAPATRFVRRLLELIECGYGLEMYRNLEAPESVSEIYTDQPPQSPGQAVPDLKAGNCQARAQGTRVDGGR